MLGKRPTGVPLKVNGSSRAIVSPHITRCWLYQLTLVEKTRVKTRILSAGCTSIGTSLANRQNRYRSRDHVLTPTKLSSEKVYRRMSTCFYHRVKNSSTQDMKQVANCNCFAKLFVSTSNPCQDELPTQDCDTFSFSRVLIFFRFIAVQIVVGDELFMCAKFHSLSSAICRFRARRSSRPQ